MTDRRAVVVGAGPAGLAAGAELARAGVPAVVLERADAVGASWRGRYERLRLNTSRWTSSLPKAPYPRSAGVFPSRDQMVSYLEDYARRNRLDVRLSTRVDRIDGADSGWVLQTSTGAMAGGQVIVATGYEHTPWIPDWPGRDRFGGRLLHAAEYRNAQPFRGMEVLVVGPGCSGVEIAYDLAEGGAGRVRLAVRTPPTIMLRSQGGVPGDLPAIAMLRLPPRISDPPTRLMGRLAIGDLTPYGLPQPAEGLFARQKREGKAPAIVDREMIDAIKQGRIEIVGGVEALDDSGVTLADATRIESAAIIAATGYRRGLEPLVGHLDVLDQRGIPRVHGGPAALPGLRFIGYAPRPGQIGHVGREARRAARAIAGQPARRGRTIKPTARQPARRA